MGRGAAALRVLVAALCLLPGPGVAQQGGGMLAPPSLPATLPGGGAHNVENALGVVAATRAVGLEFHEIAAGLATFAGVRRRQEVRGEAGGVVVIDDFAHHPTAVGATIDTLASAAGDRPVAGSKMWCPVRSASNAVA